MGLFGCVIWVWVNVGLAPTCLNMFKLIARDCGPNRMRSCALAESSTEKSAASDITLGPLSCSSVLIIQIKSIIWDMFKQPHNIYCDTFKRFGVMALNVFERFKV